MPSAGAGFLRRPPAGSHVAASMVAGAVAAGVTWPYTEPAAALLIGWDAAAAIYLLMVWIAIYRLDAEATASMAGQEDPSNPVAELVIVAASIAALVAVGFALARAGQASGSTRALLLGLCAGSVAVSWLVVHTVYTLRYARSYYSEPEGGIDFNEDDRPAYLDFAYFTFTIGMTFQVSDTNLTTKAVRRIALGHALLSYLFGAVIVALVINVVSSLLH
jgi:uncharacterized membrane protein